MSPVPALYHYVRTAPTFIGVVLGLGLTGHHLSVPAMIGAIMLVGIVLNNSIVLVDYINTLRVAMRRNQAILEAGAGKAAAHSDDGAYHCSRPAAAGLGGGEGAESRAPMAIVVAFGLTMSHSLPGTCTRCLHISLMISERK